MIRVGILGTNFGKTHADIYKNIDGVEIAGIFGRTPEKLKKLKKGFKVKITTDIDELINDPTIDLIDICLPTAIHNEYVIKALKNRKNVYCETPVCYTLEEAEEMKMYSQKYDRKLFIDLFYKFSTPHKYAIEKINENSLGKPIVVTAYQKTAPHWGDMGLNNIVINFMLHNLDFLTEILGIPDIVTAKGINNDKKSHVISTLEYKNGFASIESSSMLPKNYPFCLGFNIICESGTLTFSGEYGESNLEKTVVYNSDGKVEEINLTEVNEYEEAIKHVINCISNNEQNSYISIDDAIKSLKIAIATNESLKKNKSIEVTKLFKERKK